MIERAVAVWLGICLAFATLNYTHHLVPAECIIARPQGFWTQP